MKENETRVEFLKNGMPYAPDVKRLAEAWPVPELQEGKVITHDELAACLKYTKGSHRYYAVIDAWINKVKNEDGIFMVWERGIGVKVLDPAGILDHGERRVREKLGQTARATKIFSWADRDRLDPIGQKRLDKQAEIAAKTREFVVGTRRLMAIDLAPVKSLPKPKAGRE